MGSGRVEHRLPTGTVTLLLADVEGSTLLWERDSSAARPAMAQLDALADELITSFGGARPVEQGEGDSFVAAFGRASDAIACAIELQRRLIDSPLRVRIGLHTGEVELRDGSRYDGPTIIRAARLRDLGHGGQVLVSNLTREATIDSLPPGAEMLDLGPHPLKGIDRPERVFQLTHPDLEREFPPLRAGSTRRSNLPAQLTSLIGRTAEIDDVTSLLEDHRLVTLMGAGGCGKTRLALEVASRVSDAFPDGVWFCDLSPVTDPRAVPTALCTAIGASQQRDQTRAICAELEHKRTLVVLDNCEHLVDACAALVDEVLRRCADVTIVPTTREPLGVAGEVTWRVPSLVSPEAGARMTIEELSAFDAVLLFVERARRVRPGFELERANAAYIVEICARLDGIPLAIELASARVRTLSLEQIASGLSDRFRMLGRGVRTALPRQQTLEASVAWSYDLLSESQRTTLRRLSVFAGSFTLEGAEHVVADDDIAGAEILDLIAQLCDRSLVIAEGSADEVRYRLLETIRQFARDRLIDAGDADDAARRHLEWFERWARSVTRRMYGGEIKSSDAGAMLSREYDNLRVAIEWAIAGGETRLGLRLAVVLWRALAQTSPAARMDEWRMWVEELLANSDGVDDRTVAAGYAALCTACFFLGEMERSLEVGREAIVRARACGDIQTEILTQTMVVQALMYLDDPTAISEIEACIAAARELGDPTALASFLMFLGWDQVNRGELSDALATFDEIGTIDHAMPFQTTNGMRMMRGTIHFLRGDVDLGTSLIEGAVAAAEQTDNAFWGAGTWAQLGWARAMRGDVAGARELISRAYAQAAEGAFDQIVVVTHTIRAWFHLFVEGRPDEALAVIEELPAHLLSRVAGGSLGGETPAAARLAKQDLDGARVALAGAGTRGIRARSLGSAVQAWISWARGEIIEAESLAMEHLERVVANRTVVLWPDDLDLIGCLRTEVGAVVDAARLFGAASAGRERFGTISPMRGVVDVDGVIARAREALGPQAFEAAYTEGASMSLEDAVAFAMRGRGSRQRPASGWDSLTPAEQQVVELVAEGLTNKQVAERLIMSPRTVSTHLSHVFAKLAVSSRSELAAAAAKRP